MKLLLFFSFSLWQGVFSYLWTHKAPIVFATECETLKTQLEEVSYGNRFLFMTDMAGDIDKKKDNEIRDNSRFLLQLSLLLIYSSAKPLVQIDSTYTQYLSDENRLRYSSHDDVVQALNLVRAFFQGGMGDISHYEDWVLVEDKKQWKPIEDCIRFIETFQIRQPLVINNYHVGHALGYVPYEKQMTRNDSISGKTYACSSHFLWLKELPDPLTLDYLCSIENPLGILVKDDTPIEQLVHIIKKLNPSNHAGKITLLIQMKLIKTHLPKLIDMIQEEKQHVSWCCYPTGSLCSVHMNIHQFFYIHSKKQSRVGGVFISINDHRKEEILGLVQYISNFLKKTFSSKRNPTWNRFSL